MNDFPVIVHLAMCTGLWDRRGETLQVATKKCNAWSYFYVKSSVFGHRMSHFAVATMVCVLMCNFGKQRHLPHVDRILISPHQKKKQAKCFVMNQSTNDF